METAMVPRELWNPPNTTEIEQAGNIICSFLDTASTSYGRATHYNSKEDQQKAEIESHNQMMLFDRDLYAMFLVLPGLTDRSVQMGMKNLLSSCRNGVPSSFLSSGQERMVLYHLIKELPPPRMLKMVEGLRVGSEQLGLKKANNARTRKLILRTLLSAGRIELWAVKYRKKMKASLTHAWGQRKASIIREILKRDERLWNAKEQSIIQKNVNKYCNAGRIKSNHECIRFIFGVRDRLTLTLFCEFERAKLDLYEGKHLPKEVLEGIRSTYHKDTSKDKVLEIVKGSLTRQQKMAVQRQAEAAGIKVEMDPRDYDPIRLYIYAFEQGLTEDITKALDEKARKAANGLPVHYDRVAVIVDVSKSMEGDETQKLRPIATALAMRDMLQYVGNECKTVYCGGDISDKRLARPQGPTGLAEQLVEVLNTSPMPDAVFVISDGYENAPAGRFAEVVKYVRGLGINVPIHHMNPVFAAETGKTRELAPEVGVPTMPIQQPAAMGPAMLRELVQSDPIRGVNMLLHIAVKAGSNELRKELANA